MAEVLWAAANESRPEGRRVLWAKGAGSLDTAQGRRSGGGGGGGGSSGGGGGGKGGGSGSREGGGSGGGSGGGGSGGGGGGGGKRAHASAPVAEVTQLAAEGVSAHMPKWKHDMLRNGSKAGWRKWQEKVDSNAATSGYRPPASSSASSALGSSGGGGGGHDDVWRECGGMPRSTDKFPDAPSLGNLPNFYMYTDKEFSVNELLVCYKEKFGVNAWEDERMWELAQNTGALWLHTALLRHKSRVSRPDDAKLFIVPIDAYVSFKVGSCQGVEHKDRMDYALKKLLKSHWWNSKKGEDHVFIAPWWGAKAAWGKEIWAAASQTSVLVTFDEGFAHDWKKVVLAPYVPHALLTKAGKSTCESRKDLLRPKPNDKTSSLDRSIGLYFRGSVMHGVNCKYGDTWVRKAAYAAMEPMKQALFVATESSSIASDGVIKLNTKDQDEDTRRMKTQENQGHFSALKYVQELLRSEYCLHFRGDTTTSRRVYDAVAAGCVPVIISDNTHVPFTSSLNWNAFTVTIPERALLQSTPEKVAQLLQKLIDDRGLLKAKQQALARVRQDLLYGFGSPLDPGSTDAFTSRVPNHVLNEAYKAVKHSGKYRRFKDPSKSCVTLQSAKAAEP